jgi:hypothetical protein
MKGVISTEEEIEIDAEQAKKDNSIWYPEIWKKIQEKKKLRLLVVFWMFRNVFAKSVPGIGNKRMKAFVPILSKKCLNCVMP